MIRSIHAAEAEICAGLIAVDTAQAPITFIGCTGTVTPQY